jgi:CHAD domain-containing protein
LRSDLRTFSDLVEADWVTKQSDDLRRLGQQLGAVRDMDVLEARLREQAGELESESEPIFDWIGQKRERARDELLLALRSPEYVELLDQLVAAAHAPKLSQRAWRPCEQVLAAPAAKAARKLARQARRLEPASTDQEFHRVRIRAKRARYACEAVAPAAEKRQAKELESYAKRAARIQDILGELQDASFAREQLRQFASETDDRPSAFVAGQLAEGQVEAGRAARKQYPKAWKKLSGMRIKGAG